MPRGDPKTISRRALFWAAELPETVSQNCCQPVVSAAFR